MSADIKLAEQNASSITQGIDGAPHAATWPTVQIPLTAWTNNHIPTAAEWQTVDPKIDGARDAGLRLLCFDLSPGASFSPANTFQWFNASHPLGAATATEGITHYFDRAIARHPRVLFIVRWYVYSADLPNAAFRNASDDADVAHCPSKSIAGPQTVCAYQNAITSRWAEVTAGRVAAFLSHLDALYPGRIAGIDPTSECSLHVHHHAVV